MESVSSLLVYMDCFLLAIGSWDPLEEKPERGQWEYIGETTSS
jgi:hypothetical protein